MTGLPPSHLARKWAWGVTVTLDPHCEERSDEAIIGQWRWSSIASLRSQ